MNKTYKLLIDSPTLPMGTLAVYKDEYLEKNYYTPNTYFIFFPEDCEQKYKRGIIYKEAVENSPLIWELQEDKLDLRSLEAEKMREEARSKRWEFNPTHHYPYYYYDFLHGIAKQVVEPNNMNFIFRWNMGNCHRTEEEALAWGEKYARYFLTE